MNRMALAAVQVADRRLELREFPLPQTGPDDALLRVDACGICGSDLEQFNGQLADLGVLTYPVIPGHEPVGTIEEIGAEASRRWKVNVGDRVAVEPLIGCGFCEGCRAGLVTQCVGWDRFMCYGYLGIEDGPGLWGGYAEYMYLHPQTVVHRISPSISPEVAVMFNPLGAGIRWAYKAAGTKLGDTIVILGAGQRGLCSVIAAKAAGASTVIVTDLSTAQWKLDMAREFGADFTIMSDKDDAIEVVRDVTKGRLADAVVDVTAVATKPVTDAIEMVKKGGTIVLGGIKGHLEVPHFVSDKLVMKSITLRGVFSVDTDSYRLALNLIESGKYGLERLHTHSFPIESAEEAIATLGGKYPERRPIHIAIQPGAKQPA